MKNIIFGLIAAVFIIGFATRVQASGYEYKSAPKYSPPPKTSSSSGGSSHSGSSPRRTVNFSDHKYYKNEIGSKTMSSSADAADLFMKQAKQRQSAYNPPPVTQSAPSSSSAAVSYDSKDVYMSSGSSTSSSSILVK